MFKLVVSSILVLCATTAQAQIITTSCYRTDHGVTCTSTVLRDLSADAKIIRPVVEWRKITDVEREAWRERCKPTDVVDARGVTRVRYAEKGCEFGP